MEKPGILEMLGLSTVHYLSRLLLYNACFLTLCCWEFEEMETANRWVLSKADDVAYTRITCLGEGLQYVQESRKCVADLYRMQTSTESLYRQCVCVYVYKNHKNASNSPSRDTGHHFKHVTPYPGPLRRLLEAKDTAPQEHCGSERWRWRSSKCG